MPSDVLASVKMSDGKGLQLSLFGRTKRLALQKMLDRVEGLLLSNRKAVSDLRKMRAAIEAAIESLPRKRGSHV
jgi:hypothetical protein